MAYTLITAKDEKRQREAAFSASALLGRPASPPGQPVELPQGCNMAAEMAELVLRYFQASIYTSTEGGVISGLYATVPAMELLSDCDPSMVARLYYLDAVLPEASFADDKDMMAYLES